MFSFKFSASYEQKQSHFSLIVIKKIFKIIVTDLIQKNFSCYH